MNVNHASFPEELREVATSLRMESGAEDSRERDLLIALLRALDEEMACWTRSMAGTLSGGRGCWSDLRRLRAGCEANASGWDEAGGYTGVTEGLNRAGISSCADGAMAA